MKTRRQYLSDFFLSSAKAAFVVLCLTVSASAFVKFLEHNPDPSLALLADLFFDLLPILVTGLLVSVALLFAGYFLINKHDTHNL